MLNEVRVRPVSFNGYWMKKASLVPRGVRNGNEKPDSLAKDLEPVNKIAIRSIFVSPEPDTHIKTGELCELQGLAFDAGDGITRVEISKDDGKTWVQAFLDPPLGNYAWRRWRYPWTPLSAGLYKFKVKATNVIGETQPEHHWNRSGYLRNEIEEIELIVTE